MLLYTHNYMCRYFYKNTCIYTMLIFELKNELLLLIKKHTDTLIEQTRTRTQETLDSK